jgi:5-methylcytosine-specific restriction endonuclease McrA
MLQRGRCVYCRRKVGESFHLDHIVPLARGGRNEDDNVQITCAFCNVSKGAKDPYEFAKRRGQLL